MTDAAPAAGDPALRLAVFGFGNLGSALVEGAIRKRVLHPREVVAIEPDAARAARAARIGCRVGSDAEAARGASAALLSVKPQVWPEVAEGLAALPAGRLLISVMAGIESTRIHSESGGTHRVVRAMPNTPARIGLGITAIAPSALGTDESAFVRGLFGSIGEVVEIPEEHLHAVTAVSGSGPAYIFRFAECMEAAAKQLGLPATVARALVSRTIRGAGAMLAEDGADPATLRDAVTSRGGTTAAALEQFERWGLEPAVCDAIAAAGERARQLAGGVPAGSD